MIRTIWVFILAFIVDRASKIWALEWLAKQPGGQFALWPNVLHLRYVENRGISFSLLAGNPWLLAALSLAAMILVVLALRAALNKGEGENMLLWLLLAGGVGNMVDRLLYGYVIDFFEIRLFRFAIFNVADVCLTIAGVILIFYLLGAPRMRQRESGSDDASDDDDLTLLNDAQGAFVADATDAHVEPVIAEIVRQDAQDLADEPVAEVVQETQQDTSDVAEQAHTVAAQASEPALEAKAPVLEADDVQPIHHVVHKTKLVIGDDEPVVEAAQKAEQAVRADADAAKEAVSVSVEKAAETAEQVVHAEAEAAKEAVSASVEKVAEKAQETVAEVKEAVVETQAVIKEEAKEVVAPVKKATAKAKKSAKTASANAAPVLKQVAQAVAAPVDDAVADVAAMLSGVIAEADPVEQIVKRIVSSVEPHVSSVQETASRIVQEVKAAAVAPDQAQEIIQRVIEAMRPRIIAAQNAAAAEVKSVASQLAPGTQAANSKKTIESAKLAPAQKSAKKRASSTSRKSGGSVRKAAHKVVRVEETVSETPVTLVSEPLVIAADSWAFPRRW